MKYDEKNIADQLLKIKAVKINAKNPFTWSSGLRSPIYCDNRLLLSYPSIRTQVKQAFVKLASSYDNFNMIAGVATAGIPMAALLAEVLGLPLIYVRNAAKDHGRKNQIEGFMPTGSRVLMIEDLISTGASSIKAARAVQEAGGEVEAVCAIFSYGFELAVLAFAMAELPFRTLISLEDFLNSAERLKTITSAESILIADWSRDPSGWSKIHESLSK